MLDTLRRTDAQRYPLLIGGMSRFVGPTPGNFPVILNQWYFVFFCVWFLPSTSAKTRHRRKGKYHAAAEAGVSAPIHSHAHERIGYVVSGEIDLIMDGFECTSLTAGGRPR